MGNGGEGETRAEVGASQPFLLDTMESLPYKTEWLVKILT